MLPTSPLLRRRVRQVGARVRPGDTSSPSHRKVRVSQGDVSSKREARVGLQSQTSKRARLSQPSSQTVEEDLGERKKIGSPWTPRRNGSSVTGSPSVDKLLSQDDSFLASYADQMEDSEKDMFEETDEENNEETLVAPNESLLVPLDETVVVDKTTVDSQVSVDTSHVLASPESQPLTLPMSVLDVRARALGELTDPSKVPPVLTPKDRGDNGPLSRLVKDQVDVGPFFGLPSLVKELYKRYKGVEALFGWQERCMKSEAVQTKSNLLYSLPTSGGKTLVAELIMLQELICYKNNVIFVLPYVSLVQEKIRSLTPFALELGFCLEEYAGPRGRFPPIKRMSKTNLYVCTIEKAHSLYNSLISEGRTEEIGLLVVDEVHMLGEQGRGAVLETFITKVKYLNEKQPKKVQIVAMSATVGNLTELATFLQAELFTDPYRPVELREYLKVGRDVLEVRPSREEERFVMERKMEEVSQEVRTVDQDGVTQLVMEVFPTHSVLVFCDSKKRCENVAELLVKVMQLDQEVAQTVFEYKKEEKLSLLSALQSEGFLCPVLRRTVMAGVAYHHSGLTMDERKLLEEAYLSSVLGVMCCTSTLAAGVNLPARRVIIRSPFMGRSQLSHAQYKQMAGRAGRTGLDSHGESVLLLQPTQVHLARDIVTAPLERCTSSLQLSEGRGLASLVLNCLHLGLVKCLGDVTRLVSSSLMSLQATTLKVEPAKLVFDSLQELLTKSLVTPLSETSQTQQTITPATQLTPTRLGRACVTGNIDLTRADRLYQDLSSARPGLAVDTSLHLLYLVTPYDISERPVFSAEVYHAIFLDLAEPELAVVRGLGVTEAVMVSLMRGRSIKRLQPVLSRLYYALMLQDLWQAKPIHLVASKFQVSRGEVQALMSSAASFASSVFHFCQEIDEFWAYQELLEPYSKRLAHCASPELLPLLDLPGVKAGRARQLFKAGFVGVADIARAKPKDLVERVEHLSFKAAAAIIQEAKLVLTEKAESLKDEAQTVMLEMGQTPS